MASQLALDLREGLFGEIRLAPGAVLLGAFARSFETALVAGLREVIAQAPFRHMVTPGGHVMSVAMSNCGAAGWVADRRGYRYDSIDPESDLRWPCMPEVFQDLAHQAAARAGFGGFTADACLVNRYKPGARLSLHQDANECDFRAPIVSVSLGLPATFLFGGMKRTDRPRRIALTHGDVVVWGGPARLAYHGVMPLADGVHPVMGRQRINLTFRKAL